MNQYLQHQLTRSLAEDELLIGVCTATRMVPYLLFLILGPLAVMGMRSYHLVVTNKGIYFYRRSLIGALHHPEFFAYADIDGLKLGRGIVNIPMVFTFANSRHIRLHVPKRVLQRGRMLAHIRRYISGEVVL